jgi:hypothetical protein
MRSTSALKTAFSRMRFVAGFPSGLVISFFFSFYLLVNAITYFGALLGWLGVLVPLIASAAVTVVLVYRWQKHLEASTLAARGALSANRLESRRGLVVLVGLDSASPGTTFMRLLAEAESVEYLALVTTAQDDMLGVTSKLLETLVPVSGREFAHGRVRVWSGNNAESLRDIEDAVSQAVRWMGRHGLHPSEVVVDVTKGRRSMEFGALIAADRQHVEVQYLAADWHHLDNKPMPGTEGFMLVRSIWNAVGPEAQPLPA